MSELNESKPADNLPAGSKAVPPKSKSNNRTLIIVLVIVGALVLLPGLLIGGGIFWLSRGDNAQNLTEDLIESSTGTEVDINSDGQSFNIESDDASVSVGGDQKLPEDLPSDVVVYDNQKVIGVVTSTQDGNKNWNISSETSDESAKVASFIEAKFTENGWTQESKSTYNDLTTYSYKKDNLTEFVTVSATTDDGKLSISYSVQEESATPQ